MQVILAVGLIALLISLSLLLVFLFTAPCEALGEIMAAWVRKKFHKE